MNPIEKVSPSQMAMLLLAFTIGSSIVFIPGPTIEAAGNGAWLSVIIAGTAGLLTLAAVLVLHAMYPNLSLIECFRTVFGKWITLPFGLILLIVLLLMIANITQGLGSFFSSSMMVDTPQYVFHAFILLVSALTVHAGIEVMARLFTLISYFILSMIVVILVFNVPLYDPGMLLPQLAEGMEPILHGAYISFGFPYSESFVFAAFLYFVRKDKTEPLNRFMVLAYAMNVLLFILINLCAVMALGNSAGNRKYLLYDMARLIEITGFFERIESIAGITLITGSYMKGTVALLAMTVCLSDCFKLKSSRSVIFPLTVTILFVSLTMHFNETEAIEYWTVHWPIITSTCNVIILAAAATAWLRNIARR